MTYNFDEIIDRRHTNALNTDGFRGYIFHAGPEKVFPYQDDEFVRMWVADMEFSVAPEILDALHSRIDRRIFGYTGLYDDAYYTAFSKWCQDHYDWDFPREQLYVTPGIIPALYLLTEILCTKDEKVLLNTPAYASFLRAAEHAGVGALTSPLKKTQTLPLRWTLRTSNRSAQIRPVSWYFGAIRTTLPDGCGRKRNYAKQRQLSRSTTYG